MFTISEIKNHLTALGHGGTLNKVRNINELFERSASKFLAKCKPLETMRTAPMTQLVHDSLNNYALPSDYNSLVDLSPQDNRGSWDKAFRTPAGAFDLLKAIRNRTISLEGSEGTKIMRINWKTRQAKTLHACDSLTANGTVAVVGTASGLVLDEITKRSGAGAIRFDVAGTGDGISILGFNTVDLTTEDEVGDLIVDFYIKDSTELAKLTSVTPVWGNDITTAYWTGTAQTVQADNTTFRVGWNTIKVPWATAIETGTVAPSTIDSLKLTFAVTSALSDIRVDNIRMSIGRAFEIKYYSKYLYKNISGTYLSKPSSDDDYVTIDNDSLPIYLFELLKDMAHQVEGTDSAFDISYAENELKSLYPTFRSEYPDQRKKMAASYGGKPNFRRY